MSYPKTKAERYENFGGLNTKVSRYQTDQRQVIRLINYDFSNPGALTKRPGFQYFGGASYGGFITQLYQFEKTNGFSSTLVYGQSGLFSVGASFTRVAPFLPPGTTIYFVIGQGFTTSLGAVGQTTIPTIKTLNDTAYIAYPPFYSSWDGIGATAYGPLPSVVTASYATYLVGGVTAPYFTADNSYRWYLSILKGETRRIYGGTPFTRILGGANNGQVADTWVGINGVAATYVNLNGVDTSVLPGFGASFLLLYRQTISGVTANNLGLDPVPLTTTIFKIPYTTTFTEFRDFGTYSVGVSFCLGITESSLYPQHNYTPFLNNVSALQDWILQNPVNGPLWRVNSPPGILETFNNMMLFGGFTTQPSLIAWSNLATPYGNDGGGGPEYVSEENFADIRTNDGDILSNITAYGTECVIGKRRSFHSFTGTDPDSVSITLKSDQYGIISKRGACVWENYFWFLDRKGIVEYNGANFQVVSTPVEDIFKRMNYAWAQEIAIISHQKMRNEIWCCIPIDGATYNNIVVVYDYVSKGWSTFEGVNASALISTALTMPIPQPVIGASGGRMAQMGITHYADFGSVYTTGVRFPFVTNYGWSVQQVFRRLFVDTDPVIGQNRAFTINLYGDMLNNASYSLGTTFGATFQYRTDFGMYCKSMSVELFEATTFALKLNGYTVESRFQRNV